MRDWSGLNVVAVEAHPDDVELAVTGTLIRLSRAGANVTISSVTSGGRGASHAPTASTALTAEVRLKEAAAVAESIGARFVCLGAEDEYLFDTPELRDALVDVFREAHADLLFCCPPNDYQDDHTRSGEIAVQAAHLATVGQIRTEHPPLDRAPATYYYDSVSGIGFEPDLWIDISDVIDEKSRSASMHGSQMTAQAHLAGWDLVENLKVLGRLRGMQSGVAYAEAFQVCRKHSKLRALNDFPW